jgi:hypothetical protein
LIVIVSAPANQYFLVFDLSSGKDWVFCVFWPFAILFAIGDAHVDRVVGCALKQLIGVANNG